MLTTIYCVQPYHHHDNWRLNPGFRRLNHGTVRRFASASAAHAFANTMASRASGVVVYRMSGDPDFDDWSKPEILAALGEVPEIKL